MKTNLFFLFLLFQILFLSFCKSTQEGRHEAKYAPVLEQAYKVETRGEVDPVAIRNSKKGGMITTWGGPYPKSMNYWLDNWSVSGEIMGLLFDSLVTMHSKKNEPIGQLAKSWQEVKVNGKASFIFKIHPEAKWSDGKSVGAQDVQFYFDTIMNPKHRTTPIRVTLSRFERPEIIDEKTVRITVKQNYWKAFWDAGSFTPFPKHIWENKDFNRINYDFPVVNGPYRIHELKRNRYALLKRRGDWWGRVLKYNQDKYNFDYIRYKFLEDRNAVMEAFKKGDFDLYAVYTSSIWIQQTDFESVRKNWVVRQEVYNQEPKSFQGFAINLRRTKFQDVRVRQALCHLLDRKLMNTKLMFDQYFLLNSYFPDLYPQNINPKVKQCEYNPNKARALLDATDWKIGTDGLRRKNGEIFKIIFITAADDLRHMNLYVEELKKAGIDAYIEQHSQATVTEKIDNFKYDLYWINTSGSRLRDPEGLFHSKYINDIGTSNITGLKDYKVDSFLEKLKFEVNIDKRNKILKQLDERLTTLVPYVLLWQADKSRLLYWNKFSTPKSILDKYNRENAAIVYWSYDAEKEKILLEARKSKKEIHMPQKLDKVYYKD